MALRTAAIIASSCVGTFFIGFILGIYMKSKMDEAVMKEKIDEDFKL